MTDDEQMVEDCMNRESRLNDWERTFLDSLASQLSSGLGLSPAQAEKLEEVWERVTSKG